VSYHESCELDGDGKIRNGPDQRARWDMIGWAPVAGRGRHPGGGAGMVPTA